jgi:hypothetical protein
MRGRGSAVSAPVRINCGSVGRGKGEGDERTPGGTAVLRPWGRMGRPEVEDAPDRWVPPVGDQRERGRWSGSVVLVGLEASWASVGKE